MPTAILFAGTKRTHDDFLSGLGKGRRQSRIEPNTHAGRSIDFQVGVYLF